MGLLIRRPSGRCASASASLSRPGRWCRRWPRSCEPTSLPGRARRAHRRQPTSGPPGRRHRRLEPDRSAAGLGPDCTQARRDRPMPLRQPRLPRRAWRAGNARRPVRHTLIAHADRRVTRRVRTPWGAIWKSSPERSSPSRRWLRPCCSGIPASDGCPNTTRARRWPPARSSACCQITRPSGSRVHALYPGHRSLSAEVRVFIDMLVTHMARLAEWSRRALKPAFETCSGRSPRGSAP